MSNNVNLSDASIEELEKQIAQKKEAAKKQAEAKRKDYEFRKESFLKLIVSESCEISGVLARLKGEIIEKGNALHTEMYALKGQQPKDMKSFRMDSEDGLRRVVIENQERLAPDETSEVHINKIKDIMTKKFESRNKKMWKVIDTILSKNKAGDYDERLLAKLRKVERDINDPELTEAIEELALSFQVVGISRYCRVYVRKSTHDKWEHINLQFSAM